MEILDILYLVLMVVIMILVLSYVIGSIIEGIFLKRNYKNVVERGYTFKYEKFYCDYILISKYLNVAIGSFEIIDIEENITLLKIKNNYFFFDGSNLTFLFNSVNCIEDKALSYVKNLEKENEQNDI